MNPDTNRFEPLREASPEQNAAMQRLVDAIATQRNAIAQGALLRPDGTPVPAHWSVFALGELVVIKDYTFKVAYIGETAILFEPVGPVLIGQADEKRK
jgi:hypothetical protein